MENFPGNILLCLYFICSLIINNFEALYSQTILSTLNGEVIILMMVGDFFFLIFVVKKKLKKIISFEKKKLYLKIKLEKFIIFLEQTRKRTTTRRDSLLTNGIFVRLYEQLLPPTRRFFF